MNTPPLRRPLCPQCRRPIPDCLCRWVVPVANVADVLILQHPQETGQAKGSVRLLQLCLQRVQVLAGEAFDAAALAAALQAPGPDGGAVQAVLLYPDTAANGAPDLAPAAPAVLPALPELHDLPASRLRLVLLDATWRKSRKMLYRNPLLQRLPRLALHAPPPSQYRIRKAHAPGQLSSLEAAAHALAQIESDAEKYRPLLAAFAGFVGQQWQWSQRADTAKNADQTP